MSGAFLDFGYSLLAARKTSAASRYFCWPSSDSPSQKCASARLRVGREARDVIAEAGFGRAVVARQDELVGIAVELFRIVGGRQRRDDRCRSPGSATDCRVGSADRRRRPSGLVADAAAGDVAVLVEGDRAEGLRRRAERRILACPAAGRRRCCRPSTAVPTGAGASAAAVAGCRSRRRRRGVCDGRSVVAGRRPARLLLQLLEAELVVFLHLAHLLLHLQDLEVQFLDRAGQLADLLLERGDARIAGLREHATGASSACSLPKTPGRPMLRCGAGLARLAARGRHALAGQAPPCRKAAARRARRSVIDRNFIASLVR